MDTAYNVMRNFREGNSYLPEEFFPDNNEDEMANRIYQQPSKLDSLLATGLVHRETTIKEMRRLLIK